MEELSIEDLEHVSGGGKILDAAIGWAFGKAADAAVSGISSMIQNGGGADPSQTNAMGDCW